MAYLTMSGVHKRFGGVIALNGAHLSAEKGEVHALLGANGSGKSTLSKVLTGVVAPDQGRIEISGQEVRITGPQDMRKYRIAAVYQELSLIPQLTGMENILLAYEPTKPLGFIDRKALERSVLEVAARFEQALGRRIDLHRPVETLSPGDQQLIEAYKALARKPEILILDEATASLRQAEVEALFQVVRELRDAGVLILFISHRFREVFDLCDRATVLRNGQTVGTVNLADVTERDLVNMMVGRGAVPDVRQKAATPPRDEIVLRVKDLTGPRLHGVSFELRAGEVLGLGGLQGQGQAELLRALFGAEPVTGGEIEVAGRRVTLRHPQDAVGHGLALVPGNRAREGLMLGRPILENLTIASMRRRQNGPGFLIARREREAAQGAVRSLEIKVGDLSDPASTLSGGNQQKVVVGKWLLNKPRIILMDDPTKGVDVGAKGELYKIVRELTAEGVSVILNSSENMELLGLSHRVLVMYEGTIVDVLEGDDLNENRLVAAAMRVAQPA
ncbi:MAG TPA: sugar ABC transporter ATP-binding protein [Limnochordales bacterium]